MQRNVDKMVGDDKCLILPTENKSISCYFTEAVERSARSLTSSLMRQQPCKWRNCNAVMNSVDNLSRHLAQHVGDKPVSVGFTLCCRAA